jgi:hypothetical protein
VQSPDFPPPGADRQDRRRRPNRLLGRQKHRQIFCLRHGAGSDLILSPSPLHRPQARLRQSF